MSILTVEALADIISKAEIWRANSVSGMAERILPFIQSHVAEREIAAVAYAVDEMQRVGHIAAGQQSDVWREEAERLGMCIEKALEKMKEPAEYLGQALREHKNYVLTDGKTHG